MTLVLLAFSFNSLFVRIHSVKKVPGMVKLNYPRWSVFIFFPMLVVPSFIITSSLSAICLFIAAEEINQLYQCTTKLLYKDFALNSMLRTEFMCWRVGNFRKGFGDSVLSKTRAYSTIKRSWKAVGSSKTCRLLDDLRPLSRN